MAAIARAGFRSAPAPISPTFDPRPGVDFRLLADAAANLEASVGRLRDLCVGLADELGYTAEAIGAMRTIIIGGRR
jgi:hypothetical protein